MRVLILASALCMQFVWSHGLPASSKGVGAYAYQDSTGNRYGGTYDLEDGKVVNVKGSPPDAVPSNLVPGKLPDALAAGNIAPVNIAPFNFAPFLFEFPDFFPDELRNLQNLWQEFRRMAKFAKRRNYRRDFIKGFEDQDIAGAPSEFTSRSGDNTDISRFGGPTLMPSYGMNYQGFRRQGMGMPGFNMGGMGMGMSPPVMGPNSAFAGAAAGPGFVQHQDFISPMNPSMPNVNVMSFNEPRPPSSDQFYSVSSKSYSSSSNIGGQEINTRGTETMVNNNGEVTKYAVHN